MHRSTLITIISHHFVYIFSQCCCIADHGRKRGAWKKCSMCLAGRIKLVGGPYFGHPCFNVKVRFAQSRTAWADVVSRLFQEHQRGGKSLEAHRAPTTTTSDVSEDVVNVPKACHVHRQSFWESWFDSFALLCGNRKQGHSMNPGTERSGQTAAMTLAWRKNCNCLNACRALEPHATKQYLRARNAHRWFALS